VSSERTVSSRTRAGGDRELVAANRRFYDPFWADADLVEPERFNTWPLVSSLVAAARLRLEIAPGLRPRLPIEGTHFLDISPPAVAKLRARGASAVQGLVSALPFPDGAFDLVCTFDIIEHVDDEDGALSEVSRVAAPGAALLLSVPLHPALWSPFDDFVGHRRRYEPARLVAKLAQHGFRVERSAVYGMVSESSAVARLGMWFLTHRRERAMWWYRQVLMPLALRFQPKLSLSEGLIDTEKVDEVLLVCRRTDDSDRIVDPAISRVRPQLLG
jgi:SAM-dependent methyltransferase